MTTQIYKISKRGKSLTVRATSMKAINNYCNENGFTNWVMLGVMTMTELKESR